MMFSQETSRNRTYTCKVLVLEIMHHARFKCFPIFCPLWNSGYIRGCDESSLHLSDIGCFLLKQRRHGDEIRKYMERPSVQSHAFASFQFQRFLSQHQHFVAFWTGSTTFFGGKFARVLFVSTSTSDTKYLERIVRYWTAMRCCVTFAAKGRYLENKRRCCSPFTGLPSFITVKWQRTTHRSTLRGHDFWPIRR